METWDLEIIQVRDPWSFLARKLQGKGQPGDFEKMTDTMTDYLETALDRGEPAFRPIIGEICAAQKKDGSWHRVCVEALDTVDSYRKLKCYLIDIGIHQTIALNRILKLPSKFKDFPSQVFRCRLWGVQPLSMGFDETETGLGVQHRPSDTWDSASVNFMTEKIQESCGCRGEMMKKGTDNSLHVCLYVKLGSEWVCFNDELVHLKYAVHSKGVGSPHSSASPLEATSFNSDSSDNTPRRLNSSDNEETEKQRRFVQENLRNAKLLNLSQDNNIEHNLVTVMEQKNQNNSCNLNSSSSSFERSKDSLSPNTSSKLLEQCKIPTQARGRASLRQVLNCLRPGGLSSPESPENTSDGISKSVLSNLGQSSTPKSNSNQPTVRFSDVDETCFLSPKSHPSSPSSNLEKNQIINSVQQNHLSQRVIDFNHQGKTTADNLNYSHSPLSPISKKSSPSQAVEGKTADQEDFGTNKETWLGKMEGQRLLKQLRVKSGLRLIDTDLALPKTMRPDKPEVYPSLGTLAYGKALPMALYSVMDFPFVPSIKKVLTKFLEKEMAQGIEAYMWPAILAGRHVVGVSQPKLDNEMAYVPPLLSLITDKKDYMSIPQRMGPLVLVVVPSWKRAKQVFDLVEKFTNSGIYENKQNRCIALYAGGTEECSKTETALIRGCEILISTPGSLLRTVVQGATSLKRLCHVVLDDADILSQHYADEISGIMQMYVSVVKDRHDLTVPHQVLIFSKQWNDDVDHYRQQFTKEPVLAFSSRVEASVYGDVKQVVTMCRFQQSLANLSKLVDSMSNSGGKVIAWTSDIEEAKAMSKTINSRGVYCLLVHHGMESDQLIEDVRQAWFHSSQLSNKLVVLVATDQCYQDLAITDATAVIHYDMPSRTRFGNRMACMIQYFSDRLAGIQSEIEPLSHVILTEACHTHARSFFNVLKRCKAQYPPALQDFIKGYQMGMQTQWGTDLCPFLKSFGYCLHEDRCEQRHVLVPEKDLRTGETTHDTLPVSGEVKVKIIRVVSANHFYCRLIEHRSLDNCHTGLKEDFQALTLDLALFYSKDANHVPYLPPEDLSNVGLCGFKLDDVVHRARVVEVKEGTRAVPMKQCKVWLVDLGLFKYGTIDQLVKLPQKQADVPYQAVEVFVCRIRPIDKEAEWTDRADIFVNELVKDKILIGRIVLRLGVSMWLDPLVHQVKLKNVGLANDIVIRQEILANNFATPNPDHIQLLCELCRGKVDIPETVMQRYFDYCLEMEMTPDTLPSDGKYHLVNIAAVFSPGHFYIQKWENIEEMDKLEAKIIEEMSSGVHNQEQGKKSDTAVTLESGSVCLAKSLDGKWCRAKILSQTEEHQWEVFFLDYGDREHIPQHLVRPLPREFAKLPCQAIECQMAHIKCPGDDWSVDTVDVMCDLSQYVDGERKQLMVKCLSKTDSSHSLSQRLVVDVHGSNNVWFAEELVCMHLAVSEDESIKPLFNKPALKNQIFFNSWDKVPYLCANIYWAEDSVQSCALAKELKALLLTRTESWDSSLITRDLIQPLVDSIGYVSDPEAHGIILESLVTCCKDSLRFCEEAVNMNLAVSLSICMEQVSKSEIQVQAAKAVVGLLTQSCFLDSMKTIRMETIFMNFLESHSQSPLDITLLGHVCRCLCVFIEQDRSFLENHNEAILGHVLKSLYIEDDREGNKKPCLHLLSTLASTHNTSLQKKLMKESTIKLLIQLSNTFHNSVCLSHIVMTFQFLIEANRRNKIVLLELGLQPVIRQLCDRLRSGPESMMCRELLSSLTLQFPVQEGLAGRRIDQEPDRRICAPPVAWTETCFKVQLKVKVKNASVEDFDISSYNLKCSVLSEGTVFKLDWVLYCKVIPSKCRVEPYTSHTVISLRKEMEGKWGRLLKQKNKPSNLSPDFDYLYDSEEEEEVDDEETPELTKKRKGIFEGLPSIHAKRLYSSEDEDSDGLAIYSNSDDGDPRIDHESIMRNSLAFEK